MLQTDPNFVDLSIPANPPVRLYLKALPLREQLFDFLTRRGILTQEIELWIQSDLMVMRCDSLYHIGDEQEIQSLEDLLTMNETNKLIAHTPSTDLITDDITCDVH